MKTEPVSPDYHTRCFFCEKNNKPVRVSIHTPETELRRKNTENLIADLLPCATCGVLMGDGNVLLIEIDQSKSGEGWDKPGSCPNPYRTGGAYVTREAALRERFTEDALNIHPPGWAFIDVTTTRLLFGPPADPEPEPDVPS